MGQKRPKKVLIAEDEVLIRLDLAELLTEEGFEVVRQAADGEGAVKLVRELEPDLIIMDVKMPGVNGITAAETIDEERITPVLMFIAFSQSKLIERVCDVGVMGYLAKPLGADEMVSAIEMATGCFAELRTIEEEPANLEDRFGSRKIIDQANGMLQEGLGLIEPEAFRRIQKIVMGLCKSVREVAEGVVFHKRKKR